MRPIYHHALSVIADLDWENDKSSGVANVNNNHKIKNE